MDAGEPLLPLTFPTLLAALLLFASGSALAAAPAAPAETDAGGLDTGVLILVITVVVIVLGILGTYFVNEKYHPPGEELRKRNRPPQAR